GSDLPGGIASLFVARSLRYFVFRLPEHFDVLVPAKGGISAVGGDSDPAGGRHGRRPGRSGGTSRRNLRLAGRSCGRILGGFFQPGTVFGSHRTGALWQSSPILGEGRRV